MDSKTLVELALSMLPDSTGNMYLKQATTPSGSRMSIILPMGMESKDAMAALSFLEDTADELAEVMFGEEEDTVQVELPIRSTGRVAYLVVPSGLTPDELAEIREDMMSLVQEHVLEDAIAEAAAVELAAEPTADAALN